MTASAEADIIAKALCLNIDQQFSGRNIHDYQGSLTTLKIV
ncbi:hypothetical protein [Desulfogranum marinum]|nr:hypothetical protein [Desulfogranum marinum]